MSWKEVWVENDDLGKPEIKIKGITEGHFKKKQFQSINLSVSHTREYAVAFVIIE